MTKRASKSSRPALAPPARDRRVWWTVGIVILAAVAGAAFWRLGPAVPRPSLTGADPELVAAIDAAEQDVRGEPRSAGNWGELGLLQMAHAYWPEAEACFQNASRLEPSNWRWPYYQGACARWDSPERAVEHLRIAASRERSADAPRLLLGELLAMQGRAGEAQSQFEEVLELKTQHAPAQLGLARALFDQEQFEQSLAALSPACAHPSTRKAAGELKAQVLHRLGQAAAAQEALAAARLLPPDAPWPGDLLNAELEARRIGKQAALNRVATLRAAGALDQAQAMVQETEQKHVDLYWLIEGRLRLEHGDPVGAEAALREALALDPGSIDALFSLAQSQARQQKLSDAAATLRDLLAREPAYGPAWLELGRCLREHDPPRAIEALRAAVRYMPRSAEAHADLSSALTGEGQAEEAEKHRKLAEQLGPH